MTTESELKEAVAKYVAEKVCVCHASNTFHRQDAEAIHTLYLQAGYVMLTRDEADLLLTCFKNESNRRYLKFSPDTEMEAKLRSRLEAKE
jgi:hypothetical protein